MKTKTAARGPRWTRAQIHARAGRYSDQCGAPKQVAQAVSLSPRRLRQIRAGDPGGVPQQMVDWLDALCDAAKTNPYPLLVMLLERIHERMAARAECSPDHWADLCARETRTQCEVDLRQLALRSRRDPSALEEFCELAGQEAALLLEMMGLARAEIERGEVR